MPHYLSDNAIEEAFQGISRSRIYKRQARLSGHSRKQSKSGCDITVPGREIVYHAVVIDSCPWVFIKVLNRFEGLDVHTVYGA